MANHFREKPIEEDLILEQQAEEQVPEVQVGTGAVAQDKQPSKSKSRRRLVPSVLGGEIFSRQQAWQLIPLLLLVMIYGIALVSARYQVEHLTKEKERLTREVEYLREHRIQMQKRYQQSIKASQIAERLKERNIGLTANPPYEL